MRVPKPKKKTPRHRLVRTSVLKRIPLKHKAEKPKRFAKQRDPEYVAWIRGLPRTVAEAKRTRVDARMTVSERIGNALSVLRKLREDERLEVFSDFCPDCGRDLVFGPEMVRGTCQCWNDE